MDGQYPAIEMAGITFVSVLKELISHRKKQLIQKENVNTYHVNIQTVDNTFFLPRQQKLR
jgi:hypothetical protein